MSRNLGWWGSVVFALSLCLFTSCSNSSSNFSSTDTMYVATQGSNQVWGYRANFTNGALTTINGSPFPTSAAQPTAILIDPSHSFAYANGFDGTNYVVQRFSIDSNGSLLPISGNTPTGPSPITTLTMDSAGKFLLVAQGANPTNPNCLAGCIAVFSIGSNATLTAVTEGSAPGSPFPTPAPGALGIGPATSCPNSRTCLYVADQIDNVVNIYAFDPNAGILSGPTFPSVSVGSTPSAISLAIRPSSGNNLGPVFLYVINQGSNNLNAFLIDRTPGDVGNLLGISGSPYATGIGPVSAAVDPSVQYLYVADKASNQLTGFRIDGTSGVLSTVINSPFNTGAGPSFVAISPTNRYLYVSNYTAGTVGSVLIDPSSGNLGPLTPVNSGLQPIGIAFGR